MRALTKYAALLTVFLCGAWLAPRADSATISGSVKNEVWVSYPDYIPVFSCSDSGSESGPSVTLWLDCAGGLTGDSLRADLTDTQGVIEMGVFSVYDPFGCDDDISRCYDFEDGVWVDATASGLLYIAAPSSLVDIAFNAISGDDDFSSEFEINGSRGDSLFYFRNIATYHAIPYSLQVTGSAHNYRAPDSIYIDDTFSFDLHMVTVRDSATGEILDGARVLFAVPEPGSAALGGIGLVLIALSSWRRKRSRP